MSAYRLPSPYERPPLRRRASGLGLALAINLGLLLILMTLGIIPPMARKSSNGTVVELIPEGRKSEQPQRRQQQTKHAEVREQQPVPKPPPIRLPVKPSITPPPTPKPSTQPWIEMSKADLAAADISNMKSSDAGSEGDSEEVGHGPHGEVLYAAEWARHPTDAEIGGYWPRNTAGWGLVACKTIPGNRVQDCVELDQSPRGSHLASAVRQAAWQFKVRPPRKNAREMIGAWVRILIEVNPS